METDTPVRFSPSAVAVTDEKLTKEQALEMVTHLFCSAYGISSEDEILHRIIKREEKLSTGIGLGIAVPHCHIDSVESTSLCALLVTKSVDFNSVDGAPVKLIFLLISPVDDVQAHIACLSAISFAGTDDVVRKRMLNAKSNAKLYKLIKADILKEMRQD